MKVEGWPRPEGIEFNHRKLGAPGLAFETWNDQLKRPVLCNKETQAGDFRGESQSIATRLLPFPMLPWHIGESWTGPSSRIATNSRKTGFHSSAQNSAGGPLIDPRSKTLQMAVAQ